MILVIIPICPFPVNFRVFTLDNYLLPVEESINVKIFVRLQDIYLYVKVVLLCYIKSLFSK